MRRIASFVALLLLVSAAAPMLACVTDRALTREESVCCRAMQGKCDDMAKMGCCRKGIDTDDHPQLLKAGPALHLYWTTLALVAPLSTPPPQHSCASFQSPAEHSPPGLVIVETTTLRI